MDEQKTTTPKPLGIVCPMCRIRIHPYVTRQRNGIVRRYYACDCGQRITTDERPRKPKNKPE